MTPPFELKNVLTEATLERWLADIKIYLMHESCWFGVIFLKSDVLRPAAAHWSNLEAKLFAIEEASRAFAFASAPAQIQWRPGISKPHSLAIRP